MQNKKDITYAKQAQREKRVEANQFRKGQRENRISNIKSRLDVEHKEPKYNQAEIAKRIKKHRMAARPSFPKGFTDIELGELLNVHRNTIASWEKQGGRIPQLADMLRMCKLFDCELGYLLGEHKLPTRETTDIHATTGLSKDAIENLKNLQALCLEEGKTDKNRLDTQDVVNILLSYDGFSIIGAITDLFNTPKEATGLLNTKDRSETVFPVKAWSAALLWVQETLSQVCDLKKGEVLTKKKGDKDAKQN